MDGSGGGGGGPRGLTILKLSAYKIRGKQVDNLFLNGVSGHV